MPIYLKNTKTSNSQQRPNQNPPKDNSSQRLILIMNPDKLGKLPTSLTQMKTNRHKNSMQNNANLTGPSTKYHKSSSLFQGKYQFQHLHKPKIRYQYTIVRYITRLSFHIIFASNVPHIYSVPHVLKQITHPI